MSETKKATGGPAFPHEAPDWDYWHVLNCYESLPRLARVSFYLHHCDLDEDDEGVIFDCKGSARHRYHIKDLYYHEHNARKALLKLQRQRLAEWTKEVDQLEGEVANRKDSEQIAMPTTERPTLSESTRKLVIEAIVR